jgi:hypothetical protein
MEARVLGLTVCEPSEGLDDLFEELRLYLEKVSAYIGLIHTNKESPHEKAKADSSRATTETPAS